MTSASSISTGAYRTALLAVVCVGSGHRSALKQCHFHLQGYTFLSVHFQASHLIFNDDMNVFYLILTCNSSPDLSIKGQIRKVVNTTFSVKIISFHVSRQLPLYSFINMVKLSSLFPHDKPLYFSSGSVQNRTTAVRLCYS